MKLLFKIQFILVCVLISVLFASCNPLAPPGEKESTFDSNHQPGLSGTMSVKPTLSFVGSTGTSGSIAVLMSVTPTTLLNNGSIITDCGIKTGTTALPAWASINVLTCVISGTPTGALTATTYTIVATNAGGISEDATVQISVGAIAPTTLTRQSPTTTPNNDTTPTITVSGGDIANGLTVGLFTDSSCSTSVASGVASGTSINLTSSSLADGSYTFYANLTSGGVTSSCSSASVIYVLDSTPPAAPAIAFNSPSSSPSNISTPSFTISLSGGGNFLSSDTIVLYNQAACAGTLVGSTTSVSTATASVTASAQIEGTTTYSAKVTDAAGNSTCSSANGTVGSRTKSYLYDGTPPAAPAIAFNSPSSSPGNNATPSFTISLEGGGSFLSTDTISIYNQAACAGSSVGLATGVTSATTSVTASAQSEGTTIYSAKVTDAAGNSTCSSSNATVGSQSKSYLYDGTPPAAPGIAFNSPSSSPGNNATPSFTISLEGGGSFLSTDTITIYNQAVCAGSSVGTATSVSSTTSSITVSAQAEGTITYSAKVTDAAGNSTCSSTHGTLGSQSKSYLYDGTPPVVPVIAMAAGSANPDTSTTPIFAITLTGAINYTNADVITLYEGGNNTCNGTARGTSTISGGATASVNITANSALSSFGAVNYFAKVTDVAGNSTCTSAGISYTYRPTAPTSVTRITPASTPGNNTTPVFTVSGPDVVNGSSVRLYSNSGCTTPISAASTSGGTSINITTSTLSEGAYLVYANVTLNSTTSACSNVAAAYLVDTTAPTAPGIALNNPASSPGTNSTPSFNISLDGGGNFVVTDTITLYNASACGGSSVGTITSETSTSATITATAQAENSTTYSAKVTDEAGNSTCSSSHTSPSARTKTYLYDNTAPTWANSLSLGSTTSLSTSAAPAATYTADASDSGSGVSDYQYSIGTTSGGTQVKSWTATGGTPFTASGLTLSVGTTYYMNMRVLDNLSHASTVYTSSWQVVSIPTAPGTFSNRLVSTSLTASPALTWTASTSATSSISYYEISIGTSAGATNTLGWTNVGNILTTTIAATLADHTQYFANIRATDLNGYQSSVVSSAGWTVITSLTVSKVYATNGSNWNSYVKKDGSDAYSATDTACAGTESGLYQVACIHGGEKLKVSLSPISSCTGLSLRDDLGAFNWVCYVRSGVATFFSTSLVESKGLRDLVNATSWKNNFVTLTDATGDASQSTSTTWFSNTVSALTDNSGGSDANINLSSAGTIYTLSSSRATEGYTITANNIGVVTLPGATLSWGGSATTNCGSSRCLIYASSRKYVWVEGDFDSYNASNSAHYGIQYNGVTQARIKNASVTRSLINNILLISSTRVYGSQLKLSKAVTAAYQSGNGVFISSGTLNTLYQVDTFGNVSNGFYDSTTYAIYNDIHSSSDGDDFYFSNSDSNMVRALSNASGGTYPIMTRGNQVFWTRANGEMFYAAGTNTTSVNIVNINTGSGANQTCMRIASSGQRFYNLAATGCYATQPVYFYNSDNSSFHGNLLLNGSCFLAGTNTNAGLNSSCTPQNSSTGTVFSNVDFSTSFKGKVTSDDSTNTQDILGLADYSSLSDFFNFDNRFRMWGIDGGTFPNSNQRGICSTGNCRIWDLSLKSSDTKLLNRIQYGNTANDSIVNGAACPAYLNGDQYITDLQTTPHTYLENAYEIMDDDIGNDNGLCESGESCIAAPNFGYYQGSGNYKLQTCNFTNGTVTGVTMYYYPVNGE